MIATRTTTYDNERHHLKGVTGNQMAKKLENKRTQLGTLLWQLRASTGNQGREMVLKGIDLSVGTLLKLELGRTADPHVSVLLKLAKAFNVKPSELFNAAAADLGFADLVEDQGEGTGTGTPERGYWDEDELVWTLATSRSKNRREVERTYMLMKMLLLLPEDKQDWYAEGMRREVDMDALGTGGAGEAAIAEENGHDAGRDVGAF